MKTKFLFLCLSFCGVVHAQIADVWTPGYVWNAAANSGTDVWFGPGTRVTTNGAFARGANVAAQASTGYNVIESGAVALRDGRAVTLTATRFASTTALAASAARLAAGPVGIVAALAIPTLYDWITAEGGQHIRVNATRTGVEMTNPAVCSVAPCYSYTTGSVSGQPSATAETALSSCGKAVANYNLNPSPGWVASVVSATETVCTYHMQNGGTGFNSTAGITKVLVAPKPADWLPASMDDISPYMTPRLPAQTYPKAIIDAGGYIDVTQTSITGPSPALPTKSPYVETTTYPKPADKTTTDTVKGNPWGLAPNTPTQTKTSTGSQPLDPGSTSSTGTKSAGTPSVAPTPINTPTSTTTTSTYNPTTDTTTSTTTTSQDGASKVTSSQETTNITNTTNNSTVNITNVTTTTITNTTNNQLLTPTKTDTTTGTEKPKSDCEINPATVGCASFGDIPTADPLNKKTLVVSVAAVAFASSSACPSPLSFAVAAHTYNVSYQPLCDRLALLKVLFLAMAGVASAYILANSFKV